MNLILPKHLTTVLSQLKPAVNGRHSQSFGRRLHQVQFDDQYYWLKFQYLGLSHVHERSFQNELNVYQRLSAQQPNITAPFQILSLNQTAQKNLGYLKSIENDEIIDSMLCVKHLSPLFQQNLHTLERDQVRHVLLQSIEVLEQLHDLGFVHGDLKPTHFRQYQSQAVLIDFEQSFHINEITTLSKQRDDSQSHTATPHYMAPELFHGQAKSFASDVYALGIIWLEWLNQQKIQQKTYLDWAKWHCQSLEIELPMRFKDFETVLSLMLAKHQAQRCTNFYQIKQRLNNNVY